LRIARAMFKTLGYVHRDDGRERAAQQRTCCHRAWQLTGRIDVGTLSRELIRVDANPNQQVRVLDHFLHTPSLSKTFDA
jgi:hypothetical protein